MNIKDSIKSSGFKQWEIAESIGMSEFTLSRLLRRPERLEQDFTEKIVRAIKKLQKEERE